MKFIDQMMKTNLCMNQNLPHLYIIELTCKSILHLHIQ